jgi:hypothetical protein
MQPFQVIQLGVRIFIRFAETDIVTLSHRQQDNMAV